MAATSSPDFRLGLGDPALEFVATLAGRRREPLDRLATPGDLSRWLELAGLADGAGCTAGQLREARRLREAIYRLVEAARAGRRPAAADVDLVNRWARRPTPSPQLDARLRLRRRGPGPCPAALARLARSAVELVSGPELHRIRNCADPGCSLMFIDRSRPGRRRWCSMQRCGNRAKTARYRAHRRKASPRVRASSDEAGAARS
jgi:predicted RNA-binding Zn ribbon-like protein